MTICTRRPIDANDVGVRVHLDIEPFAEISGDASNNVRSSAMTSPTRTQSTVREGH